MTRGKTTYLTYAAGLCLLLAIFGTIMLAAGFRDASVGRVATIVVLYAVAIALILFGKKKSG